MLPELAILFPVNSFFISHNVREIIQEGFGDYTPIFSLTFPNFSNRAACLWMWR